MGDKFNKFKENLKHTVKNIGSESGKVFEKFEASDKAMEDKLKKISKFAEKY